MATHCKFVAAVLGANYPIIWISFFLEGFFATGCAFPRATARSERESRAERSTTATHGESKPFAVVGAGADGSTEGR